MTLMGPSVELQPHTAMRTRLAWALWLATFGCLAAGLAVAVAVVEPLTVDVLALGAADAVAFSLSFATVGLVLALRRPANPIGGCMAPQASPRRGPLLLLRGLTSWSTTAARCR